MMAHDDDQEMTAAVQQGIDRFGELVEEYKRMKGPDGATDRVGSADLYTGVIADSLHWARLMGFDPILAMSEAYSLAERERAPE